MNRQRTNRKTAGTAISGSRQRAAPFAAKPDAIIFQCRSRLSLYTCVQVPTFDLYMAYEKKAVVTVNGKSYLTGSAIVFYCLDDELWDVSSGDADLVWRLFEERTEQLRHGDETLPAIAL